MQSSLRQQFGLGAEAPGVKPAERGISRMMTDLYKNFAAPLTDKTMFDWHAMLLEGDRESKVRWFDSAGFILRCCMNDLNNVSSYRPTPKALKNYGILVGMVRDYSTR